MTAEEILRGATSVLVVDWPSRDVPDTLARAGYEVVVHSGPAPDDYTAYRLEGDQVVTERTGQRPEWAQLVYTHRPLGELPEIVEAARGIGAVAVWVQSGLNAEGGRDPKGCWLTESESQEGRAIAEGAGLGYFDDRYLPDVVRGLGIPAS